MQRTAYLAFGLARGLYDKAVNSFTFRLFPDDWYVEYLITSTDSYFIGDYYWLGHEWCGGMIQYNGCGG